jgi:hypothetical protein
MGRLFWMMSFKRYLRKRLKEMSRHFRISMETEGGGSRIVCLSRPRLHPVYTLRLQYYDSSMSKAHTNYRMPCSYCADSWWSTCEIMNSAHHNYPAFGRNDTLTVSLSKFLYCFTKLLYEILKETFAVTYRFRSIGLRQFHEYCEFCTEQATLRMF